MWNKFKVNNKNTKTTSLTSFWYFYCQLWTYFTAFFSISLVEFEHVNVSLVVSTAKDSNKNSNKNDYLTELQKYWEVSCDSLVQSSYEIMLDKWFIFVDCSRYEKRRVLKGHKSLASQKASLTQANSTSASWPLILQTGIWPYGKHLASYINVISSHLMLDCKGQRNILMMLKLVRYCLRKNTRL